MFPISAASQAEEEEENDLVFERIRTMLENLILQAELALIQKSKASGKVLQDYDYEKQHNVQGKQCKLLLQLTIYLHAYLSSLFFNSCIQQIINAIT
jgi:hypothetical protein